MKKLIILFVFIFLFLSISNAQNAIVGTGFTAGWADDDFEYFSPSFGSSYMRTEQANDTGNQYFRMGIDWDGTVKQITVTPGTDTEVLTNSRIFLDLSDTDSGSMYLDVSSTSDNYVFKTRDTGTDPSGELVIFRIQGNIRSVNSVTRDKSTVYPGQTVTVTANLDGELATGQGVYLRYSDDNFSTSEIDLMTGSGTSYSAEISSDLNTASNSISYYVLTSGDGLFIDHDWADWFTINLNNNSGSNYSYTVQSSWTTSGSGDGSWDDPNAWDPDAVPPSNQPVTIENSLTLDQNATVSSITINSGVTFTASDGSKANRTLTISDGGTLTNNGTFDAADGTVVFAGSGTVSGSVTFNNVEINGGVDFGSSSTINGNLSINSGGYVNNNAPTYGSNSTLIFNTGGSYNIDGSTVLWTTGSTLGQGVPNNVTVSTTDPLKIYEARDVIGNLTVESGASIEQGNNIFIVQGNMLNSGSYSFVSDGAQPLTVYGNFTNDSNGSIVLSNTLGGDLEVQGDFYDNGTFTANDRAVFLNGSSTQHLESTAAMDYLFINNSAGIILNSQLEINDDLDLTAGTMQLGVNELIIYSTASITGGSSNSYIKTNDTGVLTREAGAKADVLFPIGNSDYNPVTINNTGTTDNFSVKVADTTPTNVNDETRVVNRTWTITEGTAGGSDASITLQWNSGETGTNFDINNELVMGRYVGPGNNWETKSATGSDPYTAQASGFTSFSDFAVASGGAGTLPVQLSTFTAQYLNNQAQLYWVTQTETDNIGWNVYRNVENEFAESEKVNNELIEGYGTTTEQHEYNFIDNMSELVPGETYHYWLENLDLGGETNLYGPAELYINPEEDPGNSQPSEEYDGLYGLGNNPFNPALGQAAEISFQLKSSSKVKLDVFNVKGQLVKNLYNGNASHNNCTWNGTDTNGKLQPSGVYLYRLLVNGKVYDTQKIILFR
ncbi:MAG: T9SS type A sorting domain-containing protein [Candidatus Cloacimonetes bacterium]|nr:T9SS type A sorting domain-containing protein [Candidatus Cloacimonadota bacterium]